MSDTPTNPPTPPAPATPQPHGYFNQGQLDDIALGEDVLAAALDATHSVLIEKNKLTPEWLAKYGLLLTAARKKTTETGQARDEASAAVLLATGTERALLLQLQGIQSARKQQARMGLLEDPEIQYSLDGYLIGARLNPNRPSLLQNADALIAKAKLDNLPGYDAAAIQLVQDALDAYRDDKTQQHEDEEDKSTDRNARDKMLTKIDAGRMVIQHAADPLWPYTDKANRPIRKIFHLPLTRPFNG